MVGEPCCEHGQKYQDILKGFNTIFREDLLERQKIGIYSQNIVDISTHGDKSTILAINCHSHGKIADILMIYQR